MNLIQFLYRLDSSKLSYRRSLYTHTYMSPLFLLLLFFVTPPLAPLICKSIPYSHCVLMYEPNHYMLAESVCTTENENENEWELCWSAWWTEGLPPYGSVWATGACLRRSRPLSRKNMLFPPSFISRFFLSFPSLLRTPRTSVVCSISTWGRRRGSLIWKDCCYIILILILKLIGILCAIRSTVNRA